MTDVASVEPSDEELAFTVAKRAAYKKTGDTMDDGAYPVRTQSDLDDAARLIGNSKSHSRADIESHLRRMAKKHGLKLPAFLQPAAMEGDVVTLGSGDEFCLGETSLQVETLAAGDRPPGVIAKVSFPKLMHLDIPTPDGRMFLADGFSTRDLPLTLFFKDVTTAEGGHDRARAAGSLQHVDVSNGLVSGWGYLADVPAGREALTAITSQTVRGVSADLTEAFGEQPSLAQLSQHPRLNRVYKTSRLSGLTIVPIPAFPDTSVEVDEVFDGALTASAVISRKQKPSRAWFADPNLSRATPVTVTDDGRVFGHLALYDTCHVGLPGCRKIPRDDDFAEWYGRGGVLCDDGELVRTGTVFIGGPHADGNFDGDQAMAYYAATSYGWADVTVGYDEFGVWCAGVARPGLGQSILHHARASALSGDWRPAKQGPRRGRLTLKAILSVNSPGFPVVDYGAQGALVAAGPPPDIEDTATEEIPSVEDKQRDDLQVEAAQDPVPQRFTAPGRRYSTPLASGAQLAPVQVKSYVRNGVTVRAYTRGGGDVGRERAMMRNAARGRIRQYKGSKRMRVAEPVKAKFANIWVTPVGGGNAPVTAVNNAVNSVNNFLNKVQRTGQFSDAEAQKVWDELRTAWNPADYGVATKPGESGPQIDTKAKANDISAGLAELTKKQEMAKGLLQDLFHNVSFVPKNSFGGGLNNSTREIVRDAQDAPGKLVRGAKGLLKRIGLEDENGA